MCVGARESERERQSDKKGVQKRVEEEEKKSNTKGAIDRADVRDKTNNMKYKSGFKIEFRVLPLSLSPPLLKYTLRVTSRRHQSITNVVVYILYSVYFSEKRRGNKIITEWTWTLVWYFNTQHNKQRLSFRVGLFGIQCSVFSASGSLHFRLDARSTSPSSLSS